LAVVAEAKGLKGVETPWANSLGCSLTTAQAVAYENGLAAGSSLSVEFA
jgi:predicted transcriptional regulator